MTVRFDTEDSHHSWESFLTAADDITSDPPGFCLCSGEIVCNTDWVETLMNDDVKPKIIQPYEDCEKQFADKFEDRRIEISNFDADETTEEDIVTVCRQFGEMEWIDMSEKCSGRICVKFFDLQAAYLMKRSTIRFHGLTWIIQFYQPEAIDNHTNSPNNGKIAVFPIADAITNDLIFAKFSHFGQIREIQQWTTYRFIEFWDIRSSAKAIEMMNGKKPFGRKISVRLNRRDLRQLIKASSPNKHRVPTVARPSRKPKCAVQLDLPGTEPRISSGNRNVSINRVSKCTKPALVFNIASNRPPLST
jgi:RNA recognition motif-containing protein